MHSFGAVVVIGWAPYVGLGAIALYLGGRYVRALEQRHTGRADLADIQEQLLRLEEAVSDVSRNVDRVAEGQSFTTRLLAERDSRRDQPSDAAR